MVDHKSRRCARTLRLLGPLFMFLHQREEVRKQTALNSSAVALSYSFISMFVLRIILITIIIIKAH